jgi:phenylpropionate dioxygenase-like ring-hydroxylating dioxygenase large terminal subunit
MLSDEKNKLLTRIGPGAPMGGLIRRYWIPALFSRQLPEADGAPVRVRLMGEDLVAFRDSRGRVGLLGEYCPHRTVSLFFSRNEECGLRCVYHGWKFDVDGRCVDMPSEPANSPLKANVKATAYPCLERGGVVWTYMGPPELKPDFPEIEWALLPDNHRHLSRRIIDCNWLQSFEGGFDSSHLSFLHKGNLSLDYPLPAWSEFVPTDSGFIYAYAREVNGKILWSADTMLMPFHKLISMTLPGAHVWVPIDDEHTMLYTIDYDPVAPLTPEQIAIYESGVLNHAGNAPGSDRSALNLANDYGIDRALQRSGKSYTGMKGVSVQDSAMQESMGPIADRTQEHLGASDMSVIKLRQYLLGALEDYQAGRDLPSLKPEPYRVRPLFTTTAPGAAFAAVMAAHEQQVEATRV